MAQAAHILRFTAKPDSKDELMAVFARALPLILDETTTVSWFVGGSENDQATFVLAHAFDSTEAREAHFEGPAARLIMTEGAPFFAAEPKVENLAVIAGEGAGG